MSVRSRFAVDVGAIFEHPWQSAKTAIKYVIGAVISVWMLFPIVWMGLISFQPNDMIQNMPPNFVFAPTPIHYVELFVERTYHQFLFNSLVVALTVVTVSLFIAVPAAYSLSRMDVPGGHHFAFYILSTRMVPPLAIIVPLFAFYQNVGLTNTRIGLIIVHFLLTLPLMIWIIKGFIDEVPESLEESAMVSGCNRLQAFREVTLPLVMPGVTAAAFLAFIFSWNDFQLALVLVSGANRTAPLVIQSAMGYLEINWGLLGAAGVVTIFPVIVASLLIRNYLIEGMTMGAVKE
jgi:multiple sugar transport system permease protein